MRQKLIENSCIIIKSGIPAILARVLASISLLSGDEEFENHNHVRNEMEALDSTTNKQHA